MRSGPGYFPSPLLFPGLVESSWTERAARGKPAQFLSLVGATRRPANHDPGGARSAVDGAIYC